MHRRYRLPHVPPDVEALGRGEAHRAVVAADAVELKPRNTSFFRGSIASIERPKGPCLVQLYRRRFKSRERCLSSFALLSRYGIRW